MALVVSHAGTAENSTMVELSKEYVFKIQNPSELENKFTVRKEKEAIEIMKGVGIDDLDKLKELLGGIDFTSVSTRQLDGWPWRYMKWGIRIWVGWVFCCK